MFITALTNDSISIYEFDAVYVYIQTKHMIIFILPYQ